MGKNIFITGSTGYIGSRLLPMLLEKGYKVKALVRKGSEKKLSSQARSGNLDIITGNAMKGNTYAEYIKGCNTFIHLIGVSHPGPGKEKEFNEIDLVSIREAAIAAKAAGVQQFIYLSVAEPAPVMKEFINVRKSGEKLLTETGMNCVFIKPWYVLGPGHYWPHLILPVYWVFMLIPPFSKTAKRLYPVRLKNVLNAITSSIEKDVKGITSLSTEELRK